MPARSSLRFSVALLTAPLLLAACGSTRTDGVATLHDAGVDSAVARDGGVDAACVASPVEGAPCSPGESSACAQAGDPCCIGYVWSCPTDTSVWTQEGLGCACPADAGVLEDAASGDASTAACGGCDSGEICVVTTSGGGACLVPPDGGTCPNGDPAPAGGGCCDNSSVTFACQARPAACGDSLSCGCAASLCECTCQSASESTLQCLCEFP